LGKSNECNSNKYGNIKRSVTNGWEYPGIETIRNKKRGAEHPLAISIKII